MQHIKTTGLHLYVLIISTAISFGCNEINQNKKLEGDSKKEKFISQLKKINWEEPDKIISLIEPAIVLIDAPVNSAIGGSRLGGQPDLPDTIDWPASDGKPMIFYGQINLSDINKFDKENILPEKGILYFFSYFKNPENEFGAEYLFHVNKNEYKVIYFDGEISTIKKRNYPDNLIDAYRFHEMPIDFELIYQVPKSMETWKYENAKLNKTDADLYDSFNSQNGDCISEMILGTPCPIQYGADYDWAYSYLNTIDYTNPQIKEKVDALRPEFINLLSFTMLGRFEKHRHF